MKKLHRHGNNHKKTALLSHIIIVYIILYIIKKVILYKTK